MCGGSPCPGTVGCMLRVAFIVIWFKTDHTLCCQENKVEFLEGRFLGEKFPFLHERKMSILLNFLFPFFVFEQCIFNLEMQDSGLKTTTWRSQQPFCWIFISFTKVSKYGKSEYSWALNTSYTFQPLMSFWCKSILNWKVILTSCNISLFISQHLLKTDYKIFQNALNWKITLMSCNISLFVSEHLSTTNDKIFENAFFHEYFIYTGKLSPNCKNLLVF